MTHSFFHRSIATALSVIVTLAMLGSIDRLAHRTDADPQWARQATPLQQPRG